MGYLIAGTVVVLITIGIILWCTGRGKPKPMTQPEPMTFPVRVVEKQSSGIPQTRSDRIVVTGSRVHLRSKPSINYPKSNVFGIGNIYRGGSGGKHTEIIWWQASLGAPPKMIPGVWYEGSPAGSCTIHFSFQDDEDYKRFSDIMHVSE